MSDSRHSILTRKQIPEFIREEYPKFVSFVEAYYEFLDSTVLKKTKEIRNISDVDSSLENFEQHFFNTYLTLLPRDVSVRKDILIKNINDLYSSKGTEKSYKLFFKLLFNEDVEVQIPKNNVLRASDGRWLSENSLRIIDDFYTEYIYDGIKSVFYIPFPLEPEQIELYVNGNITREYFFRKEYNRIELRLGFININLNDVIKIKYSNLNPEFFTNKKVSGKNSGSSAIIESSNIRKIAGINYYEFIINEKTLYKNFLNAELVEIFFNTKNGLLKVTGECFSDVDSINIIEGGQSYNVGDPVLIKGNSNRPAIAVVSEVSTGVIDELDVISGGSGYQIDYEINEIESSNSIFMAKVVTVDSTGTRSSNTILYNTDIISNHSSISIGAANYNFPNSVVPIENVNTVIASALTMMTMNNFGSITSVDVTTSLLSSEFLREFKVVPPEISWGLKLFDLYKIGSIRVNNAGLNYQVGENLIFSNRPPYFSGRGANAYVSSVYANGGIKTVTIRDGGFSYSLDGKPLITIETYAGTGANLEVDLLMSSGENFTNETSNVPYGVIKSIGIIDSGRGYASQPLVDLSEYGNKQAKANAVLRGSYVKLGGRWETSDGLLSDDNIKLQGNDYYIDFSYVLSSKVEFSRYKKILKELLHPVGLVVYSRYEIEQNVPLNNISTQSYLNIRPGPTVNVVANSVIVIGNNTSFLVQQNAGTLTVGSYISINSQIRIVNAISSNTSLNVSENFTITSNNQKLNILNIGFEAILTENYREIATQNNVVITTEKDYLTGS